MGGKGPGIGGIGPGIGIGGIGGGQVQGGKQGGLGRGGWVVGQFCPGQQPEKERPTVVAGSKQIKII